MVNSKRSCTLQTAILIAFFTASGALTSAGNSGIGTLEWIAAGLISALVLAVIALLVRWLPLCSPETGKSDRSAIALIFAVLVWLISLEIAIDAVSEYAALTSAVMLRESREFLPILLLIFPACLICRRADGILKFAPLALLVGAPVFLMLFSASFDGASLTDCLDNLTFTPDKLPLAYAESFAFVSLVLLCSKKAGATPTGNLSAGAVAGGAVAGALCMQSISVLGSAYAAALDYPYAEAVSAITLGGALTRPDGFGYTLVTLCQIIRLSIAGNAFLAAAEPFFGERRLPNLLFFTLTAVLCVILGSL